MAHVQMVVKRTFLEVEAVDVVSETVSHRGRPRSLSDCMIGSKSVCLEVVSEEGETASSETTCASGSDDDADSDSVCSIGASVSSDSGLKQDSAVPRQTPPCQQMVLSALSGPLCYVMPVPCSSSQVYSGLAIRCSPPGCWQGSVPVSSHSIAGQPRWTTLMLKHLSSVCSHADLVDCLERNGFTKQYDFLYLPTNFKTQDACSYAFLNMTTHEAAVRIMKDLRVFQSLCKDEVEAVAACWSDLQGLAAHVDRYRNSPVMHPAVPEKYRPLLFSEGEPVPFPAPSKRVKAPPRLRKAKQEQ